MTATLILGINIFVAALFAVAFAVVATNNPTAGGAKWLAAASALGIIDVALEFVLPWQDNPALVATAILFVFLLAMTAALVGISRHYKIKLPLLAALAVWVVALVIAPLNLALPYGSEVRAALYQFPYALMQALIALTIFRSGSRKALDVTLLTIASVSVLVYAAKPLIAWHLGSASMPQDYMMTQYAAISQSLGTVTLIAMALTLLLIMMRDLTIELIVRSETDPLSGVMNRRGFDVQGERLITVARKEGMPVTLVTVDIDHFKKVNDRYGHVVGDGVIAQFAQILAETVPSNSVVARLGGEEFAVLLYGKTIEEGLILANDMRVAVVTGDYRQLEGNTITASFGVAELAAEEDLFSTLRRADAVLYRAKAEGRNTVRCATGKAVRPAHDYSTVATAHGEIGDFAYSDPEDEKLSKHSSLRINHRIGLTP